MLWRDRHADGRHRIRHVVRRQEVVDQHPPSMARCVREVMLMRCDSQPGGTDSTQLVRDGESMRAVRRTLFGCGLGNLNLRRELKRPSGKASSLASMVRARNGPTLSQLPSVRHASASPRHIDRRDVDARGQEVEVDGIPQSIPHDDHALTSFAASPCRRSQARPAAAPTSYARHQAGHQDGTPAFSITWP